jgi:hypothetical protein
MFRLARLLPIAFACAAVAFSAGAASALSLQDKATLQAAMQRHVDRQSVEGAYLHLDAKSGDVVKLHPVTAHPMIMRMGENFVLCFDFRDSAGKDVPIDFYMARKKDSFVVFHASVSDRSVLQRLMQSGKVVRAD